MVSLSCLTEFEFLSGQTEQVLHVVLKVQTPAKENSDRTPFNIGLVLDRSGSMWGDKIVQTRHAARHLIERLQGDDTLSMVCYDDIVDVLSLPVSGSQKDALKRSLDKVEPRGSTNLSAGWLQGLSLVQKNSHKQALHRILLLTDGLANAGVQDRDGLVNIGRSHLNAGIRTSTLGFGADFNEDLLTAIADESGGNFYFIDSPERAPQVFLEELGELASVIGQNLELTVECSPGLRFHSNLSLFPGDKSETRATWKLGDLYANDTRLVVFSLTVPANFATGPAALAQVGLSYHAIDDGQGASAKRQEQAVMVTFDVEQAKQHGANEEVLRESLVLRSALDRERATQLADQGDWLGAKNLLTASARTITNTLSSSAMSEESSRFLRTEASSSLVMRDEFVDAKSYSSENRKKMKTAIYQAKKQRGGYKKSQ